jgi:hypothetical protein
VKRLATRTWAWLRELPARLPRALAWLQAVAVSILTRLAVLAAAVAVAAPELAELLPGDTSLTAWLLRVGGWAALLVAGISRVTPVLRSQRGVLNPEGITVVPKSVPTGGAVLELGDAAAIARLRPPLRPSGPAEPPPAA